MEKVRVGISCGDINGIGLEVIIKTMADVMILNHCIPVIYASSKIVSYHKNIAQSGDFSFHSTHSTERLNKNKVNVLNCWQEAVNINMGQATEEGGKYAYISLDRATRELKNGSIDVLVTAPINKQAMRLSGFPHPGHTEYLSKELGGETNLMMMVSNELKVALATSHIPISEIASFLTADLLRQKLSLLINTLKTDFAMEKPSIAILGLNPHAGDNGIMGSEEEEIIRPVIIEAKKQGNLIMGPYASDGFFGASQHKKFDGILAMYHDQGLIPFKTLSFDTGVNYTAGLPFVRTSPDHGTAYDLAGKNEADPSSFRAALFLAIDIFKNQKAHKEMIAEKIQKKPKSLKEVEK
jgi:4-hydroxythreonine-4-phosphate dehydrogenase